MLFFLILKFCFDCCGLGTQIGLIEKGKKVRRRKSAPITLIQSSRVQWDTRKRP